MSRNVAIFVYTLYIMSNKITIDLDKYCTQVEYAKLHGYKLNTVSQWIKRAKAGEGQIKIEYLDIPQLSITLVKKIP